MKPPFYVGLIFFSIFSFVMPVYSAENIGCAGASFSEVRSLADLPEEVSTLLGKYRRGTDGIADRDGQFNKTDVLIPNNENLPFRRFNLAAVSAKCILVAVEHGGRGYAVEVWAFERTNSVWHSEKRQKFYTAPLSLQQLITHANE